MSVVPFLLTDTTAPWPLGRRFAWICWGGGCRAGSGGAAIAIGAGAGGDGSGGVHRSCGVDC